MEELANLYDCEECDKQYQNQTSLRRHVIKVHGAPMKERPRTIKCMEDECGASFPNLNSLRIHLTKDHGLNASSLESLWFTDVEEFDKWKTEEELTTGTSFFQCSGVKRFQMHSSTRYLCNRTGIYKPRGGGIRQASGTAKLGYHCTAEITVVCTEQGVKVNYYNFHYKHGRCPEYMGSSKDKSTSSQEKAFRVVKKTSITDKMPYTFKQNPTKSNPEWKSRATFRHVKHMLHKEFTLEDEDDYNDMLKNKILAIMRLPEINSATSISKETYDAASHHLNEIKNILSFSLTEVQPTVSVQSPQPAAAVTTILPTNLCDLPVITMDSNGTLYW